MGNETRVNIKHLLEDLRDAYTAPLEEVVATELIANALDSGASDIRLETDRTQGVFRCIDNGDGMNRAALRNYHNIAASTKERGFGIGFAGVGAKLALLVAEKVLTETRGKYAAQGGAQWYLKDAYRAPWKFIPFSGIIANGRGTAVSIYLKELESPLLQEIFLQKTVQRHFYPIVCGHEDLLSTLKKLYKKTVTITVNGRRVRTEPLAGEIRSFSVFLGKSKKPIGAGFIENAKFNESFWERLFVGDALRPGECGLRISTYGKVIKGGWEWLGIAPKHPELLSGVVEVPAVSELLTTNKSDFLTDPVSLKKYYRIRKAIQQTILPILRELGALSEHEARKQAPAQLKPLEHDIEGALSLMAKTFPELETLVGGHWRRLRASEDGGGKKEKRTHEAPESLETPVEHSMSPPAFEQEKQRRQKLNPDPSGERTKRAQGAGLEIALEDFTQKEERMLLGKYMEERVIVNTAHPAWSDASKRGQEPYHVLLTVAVTLGEYMQSPGGLSAFISQFLSAWSEASKRSGKLL